MAPEILVGNRICSNPLSILLMKEIVLSCISNNVQSCPPCENCKVKLNTEYWTRPAAKGKKLRDSTERPSWWLYTFSCDYTLNQYEFSITPYYVFIYGCSSKPSTNPLHSKISIHFLHTGLSTFHYKKNLFDNQELVKLVIISVILLTFAFDSRLILWGELRSRSLLGSTFLHLYSRVPMSWTSCNKIQFYSLHIQRSIFPICLWNTMMLGSNICVSGYNRSTRFPRTPRCKRRKSKELNLFSEIFFIVAVA